MTKEKKELSNFEFSVRFIIKIGTLLFLMMLAQSHNYFLTVFVGLLLIFDINNTIAIEDSARALRAKK